MNIKINDQLICISPYVSTRWEQVSFLKTELGKDTSCLTLILSLVSNNEIAIPNLPLSVIDLAFSAHLQFLEKSEANKTSKDANNPFKFITELFQQLSAPNSSQSFMKLGIPLLNLPTDFESVLQHDISQKDTPTVPKKTLDKLGNTLKMMLGNNCKLLLSPEPHCNCLHCQTGRFLFQQELSAEDDISNEDLTFRSWDIIQNDSQIYTVTNPLDPKEQYNVSLGNPVKCSCGQHHCEHIKAVLYS